MGYKHGHSAAGAPSSTYRVWQSMLDRCLNANCTAYKNYGGRGIKVCDRWRDDFANFLADVGERPPGRELDRYPNNDGNYEPGNVRWATVEENQNNKRTNHLLTHNGETMTIAQWARRIGCRDNALSLRLSRSGMSVKEALETPWGDPYETRRKTCAFERIVHAGESLTAHQWAKRTGLPPATIRYRISAGWTPERALTTPARAPSQAWRKAS